MLTKTLTINDGFRVLEQTHIMDAFYACDVILSTEKQFKYTKAVYERDKNTVELTRHIWVCPCCGYHMPAYPYFHGYEKPAKILTRSKAKEFCGQVKSLLDNEKKTLDLYEPLYEEGLLSCPQCREMSFNYDTTNKVTIKENKGKITVSYTLERVSEILDINWIPEWEVPELPLQEVAVFNLKKGKTYFEIRKPDGELVCVRDVTNVGFTQKRLSKLTYILNTNIYAKKELRKSFNNMWGIPVPFESEELDLQRFVLLTSYVGYTQKEFFYNIPCEFGELTPHSSFKNDGKKLHRSENCIALMEKSGLPQVRSIKKMMYTYPHFFFFINELKIMWELLGKNYDLFLNFLSCSIAVPTLVLLRTNPGVIEFFSAFSKVKNPYQLLKLLKFYRETAVRYAVFYLSFSKKKKKDEQKRWGKISGTLLDGYDKLISDSYIDKDFVTLPVHPKLSEINGQVIDGYSFIWLKTNSQFSKAGNELNNCLGHQRFDNPVFAIMSHGHYVAAVEVDIDSLSVVQAYIKNNNEIDEDKAVFAVYKKWCKLNHISLGYRSRYPF